MRLLGHGKIRPEIHEMRKQSAANQAEDKPTRVALAFRALTDETNSLDNHAQPLRNPLSTAQFSRALAALQRTPGDPTRKGKFIEETKSLYRSAPRKKI